MGVIVDHTMQFTLYFNGPQNCKEVKKVKLSLVCTEMLPIPPVAGGAVQQYIEGILPYLSKVHDVTVYSTSYPGLNDFENANEVKHIRLKANNRQEYLMALETSIDKDSDFIYIFNRPEWVVELGEVFKNSKFALSIHNEMFDPRKLPNEIAVKCIERVEFIITVSKFIANNTISFYPDVKEKIHVVYSAADPDKYQAAWSDQGMINRYTTLKKYNIENYKTVLYVGRLIEKKGPHILMRGMESLMNYRNDVALLMVGSRWYGDNSIDIFSKTLHFMAEDLSGPVVFTGFLTPKELYEVYNAADIFVCPSQWQEPLARVHYEAMASGVPIITTNRGGNAEVVSGFNNGIVINDYTNPEKFAYNINYLLNNPYIANEMGRSGRKLVEDYFNWKRTSEEILSLIEN